MSDNGARFSAAIELASLVVLCSVDSIRRRGAQIRARRLELYKGDVDAVFEFRVPTLWGRYAFDWFKSGEEALVLASGDPPISHGRLGRMPIVERDGCNYCCAFVNEPDFFHPLPGKREEEERVLVQWADLRHELLRIPRQA